MGADNLFADTLPNRTLVPVPANAMNRWETSYALHLTWQVQHGEILGYMFECYKLRLANRTWWAPDFMVLRVGGLIEFHEVKGWWREDARVKFKVVAEQYQGMHKFVIVTQKRGRWHFEELL